MPLSRRSARFFSGTVTIDAKPMAIRIVRFGTPKRPGEGVRLGTVRRPPRGVPKREYAAQHYYDVWLPNLAPSAELVRSAKAIDTPQGWRRFAARYRAEMARPEASRVLDALAALSHGANFSVGCYCEDERRCHRSVLREILDEHGAEIARD
jgi:uncharacterized protein YeaO (DUF488 family)